MFSRENGNFPRKMLADILRFGGRSVPNWPKRDASVECFASSNGQSKLVTRSSANREVSVCKKKKDSVKYLRRWISVAATAALPTPRILTKYSRSFIRFRRNISLSLSLSFSRAFLRRYVHVRISNRTIAVSTRP